MNAGDAALSLAKALFPICRSITGDGVRETLRTVAETLPLALHEVPSGTQVFDWTVPKEWNVRDAYVANSSGARVVDFQAHNLHLVSYSVPTRTRMCRDALDAHLHSLPDRPDVIPYRTSYYAENFGFCLPHAAREALPAGDYEVVVDTTLEAGHLSYGECFVRGESEDEVLLYTHVCHPSLANDNVSGIAVLTQLGAWLASAPRRLSYRLVFAPGTIGSITWLSRNVERLGRIRHGFVLGLLGNDAPFTYKRSRHDNALVDRAATHVLGLRGDANVIEDFSPYGYDERQFGSPGIALPVGRLTRSPHAAYPEYHTSADSLELLSSTRLAEALDVCTAIIDVLEDERAYENLEPHCEPQLGRRGLYHSTGGVELPDRQMAMLWLLSMSDGSMSLLDIAERARLPFASLRAVARELEAASLLRPVPEKRR